MQKSISFRFHFCLFIPEEYNVDKITGLLKMEPTKKWVKDESNPKPLYRDSSGWEKSSAEIFSFGFDEPFSNFLKELEGVWPAIRQLITKDKLSCKMDVVIKIYKGSTMPGIYIDEKILAILSSINCSIDFDMYDLRDNIAQWNIAR